MQKFLIEVSALCTADSQDSVLKTGLIIGEDQLHLVGIKPVAEHLVELLKQSAANPDTPIKNLRPMTDAEIAAWKAGRDEAERKGYGHKLVNPLGGPAQAERAAC